MSPIVARLFEVASARGHDMQSLSRLTGYSRQGLTYWRDGMREPGVEKVERLAKLLDLNLELKDG